ncbi:MAG: SufD family Fe-S cluster assembly protein [Candidatus Moranbacteria bacterium]|nr:SufD family Fe-S cluster assembly protein [Candidatus Moranbacteria bacterium]
MQVQNITDDTEQAYRLAENERAVFVAENRADDLTFELSGPGAEAHVFAFFSGTENERFEPKISVRHLAPDTVSRVTVRGRLDDASSLRIRSLVEVAPNAVRSDAREDIHALLRSPEAGASAVPELEIGTDDITCTHAAVIAPPDPEQLHYLATRGIPTDKAIALLSEGLFRDARDIMTKLAIEN